jgi:hypothetical protein
VPSTSHLAELEIESTDVVAAWSDLEPVVARCAETWGAPATKSDYRVGHSDDQGTVAGPDLGDCLDLVKSPASIAVTYTASSSSGTDARRIELRIVRYRRHKELNVHLRVDGPADVQTLGFFERSQQTLTHTIESLTNS